jgi:hypothetical protein
MDNVYIWVRNKGILISRGNAIDESIKNLEKYYPKEALIGTYGILDRDGYFILPTIVLNGDGSEPVPKVSVILDVKNEIKEWKRW